MDGGILMKEKVLLFSSEVILEDNRCMKLNYSMLVTNKEEGTGEPYYGISISRYLDNTVETEEVEGISYSREAVVSMIKTLYHNVVTPISMIEIVDDLVTAAG
jgi:hypothetical protein